MPQRIKPTPFALRRVFKRLIRVALSMAILLSTFGSARPVAAAVPTGFTDTPIVDNIGSPTAIAFTPDGRLLVTNQPGTVRVYQNGTLLSTPALDFTDLTKWLYNQICGPASANERGLLGVAVDPNFAVNNYIYLYYTFQRPTGTCSTNAATDPVNRVSRFILPPSNTILTTTQIVLVDNIYSTNGNHNGGDLHFGKDSYLYISVGDSGTGGNRARALDNLSGKILRIDPNGSSIIPAANPYASTLGARRCGDPAGVPPGSGPCQEIVAFGLRNPFRIAFDPNAAGTRFFINDVGQDAWEEIDDGLVGGIGAVTDYGWNCREGANPYNPCMPPNMVDPIFEYEHSVTVRGTNTSNCNVITGGAFVPNGLWPGFDGVYLFTDNNCGTIFKLSTGYTAADFITGLSLPVYLTFGPYGSNQALYYTTYASGGEVHRVTYTVFVPAELLWLPMVFK